MGVIQGLLLQNHDALTVVRRGDVDKMLRQSVIMLRILLCFDIFFLVSTVVQVIWMTPAVLQRDDGSWDLSFLASQPYLHSYSILALFTTTLLCNSMATTGVTRGKRMLVLPFISDVIYNPFSVSQIFLLLLMLLVMSAWRHMQVVFIVMGSPDPPRPPTARLE